MSFVLLSILVHSEIVLDIANPSVSLLYRTMSVIRSEKVLLQDVYVNNTVWNGTTLKTYSNDDGIDTVC